jgi:hypothetical protein
MTRLDRAVFITTPSATVMQLCVSADSVLSWEEGQSVSPEMEAFKGL